VELIVQLSEMRPPPLAVCTPTPVESAIDSARIATLGQGPEGKGVVGERDGARWREAVAGVTVCAGRSSSTRNLVLAWRTLFGEIQGNPVRSKKCGAGSRRALPAIRDIKGTNQTREGSESPRQGVCGRVEVGENLFKGRGPRYSFGNAVAALVRDSVPTDV
jgi:hypothetical protein